MTLLTSGEEKSNPRWKVHAYFLDACNCDWGCPCQFNAKPTHDNCEGVAGYHIVSGIYGTKVKLDGLNMALITSWPGPIHEGHGTASFYIDNRANEYQFEALSNIITGRAGGGPFEVYASTIEKLQEPKRAGVKFQTKDLKSRVSVFDTRGDRRRQRGQSQNIIAEAWLEPIKNPVTGKVHRAIFLKLLSPAEWNKHLQKNLLQMIMILIFDMKEHMAVSQKICGRDLRY